MAGLSNSRHSPWRTSPLSLTQPSSSTYSQGSSSLTITPALAGPSAPTPSGITQVAGQAGNFRLAEVRELDRYTKIVRRMTWKYEFLDIGYRKAISRVGQLPEAAAEAETMFKLDFFEFYMLLERALVHLLSVFRVTVSRDTPSFAQNNDQAAAQWQKRTQADHRYHANVLEALENPMNPFHEVLGTGEVRRQLGRAKELRNRWKTAADEKVGTHKMAAPLESYEFERIFSTIFSGLDEAFKIAHEHVNRAGEAEASGLTTAAAAAVIEEDWGFMTDAMDWEAV